MKKILSVLLSMVLALSLAACGGRNTQPAEDGAAGSTAAETAGAGEDPEASAGTEETSAAAEDASEDAGGTLIAYFSWSGNTAQMAQMIQEETGADLFEIEPAVPYTDDYDTLLDVAQQEQSDNARPEIAGQVENWDSYDVVFVGYPDWWGDAPMIIYTFLESYDWTGKTLVPFCTSGGSGFGRSLDKLSDSAPGAGILEGLHVSGSSVDGAGEEIASWIGGLDLA
ncbi:MAG TPA: flavodoxin [Candidatus Eisenbergiella merdipullorum]|uniref:Flavodoxin n=1 Tax=Candidatus Eisenbergiella merdipullorum TaxID=2838553 RepID=A0A9D2I8H6_9FIRM|nr:flavodoxin [Candidatus Eisenbergiella merdipullorum]